MGKLTKRQQFRLFRDEFFRYRDMFGRQDYACHFELTEIDGAYADIAVDNVGKTAHVRYAKNDPDKFPISTETEVRATARHEAIHLLLAPIEHLAASRFISQNEIDEEVESLTRRLEDLIDG